MTRRRRLPTEGDSRAAKKARAFAKEPGKSHPRQFVRSIAAHVTGGRKNLGARVAWLFGRGR